MTGPDRASGGSGGAAVRLDAVLAEQVAQAVKLAVQSLVFRDEGLAADAGRQLVLQPCLVGKQEAFPVAQRRGAIEIPGVEGGLFFAAVPG